MSVGDQTTITGALWLCVKQAQTKEGESEWKGDIESSFKNTALY